MTFDPLRGMGVRFSANPHPSPLPLMGVWGIWDIWGLPYYQREKQPKVHLFDAKVHLFDAKVHLFDAKVHLFDATPLTAIACAPTDRWHNA